MCCPVCKMRQWESGIICLAVIGEDENTQDSRIPTLNNDSNCATLTVPYVAKVRSQKAKLTESILAVLATRSYRSSHVSCKEVTRWTLSVWCLPPWLQVRPLRPRT